MPALVAGIYVFLLAAQDVDGRNKSDHDGARELSALQHVV
jgi:hypothetical protein